MSCGVGRSLGLGPELLLLWCRSVAAVLIRPLAWELPYAAGAALKRPEKKKKRINHKANQKSSNSKTMAFFNKLGK